MARRPRVLAVTSTYPRWPGDSHPGFVHDLCARLVDDLDVTVLAPYSHGSARHEVVDGVTVERVPYWRDRPGLLRDGAALPTLKEHPTTALQVPTYLAAMHRAIGRHVATGEVDVLHAHWVVPQGTLAALRRRRVRVVMTAHGSDLHGVGRLGGMVGWTLRRADAFTGVSSGLVARARELGLSDDVPAEVAPMGVDTDRFRPDEARRATHRASHGIDGPLVLYVGRLTPVKGPDVLVEALPRLLNDHPDAVVAMAGTGELQADLERSIAALPDRSRVRLLGHLDREAVADWYRAADVLVAPSRSEGFGLAIAEALVTGTPVVVSDLPATREIVDGQTVGTLVPVADARALAAAVDARLRAGDRDTAVADAARQAGRFGWDVAAERYRRVLTPTLD